MPVRMDEALRLWREELGEEAVLCGHALQSWTENVSGFTRRIPCVLLPRSTDDVVQIVKIANRFRIPLYPISRGSNWGMGSRLPVRDDTVIVDLRRMDRIREVNASGRYAVLEPGVTQAQLFQRLEEDRLPLIFNVTGSSSRTSLIGNALDRGVGYMSSRAEALSGLEVVLGTGEVIQTGFGHFPGAHTTHLYRHGIGPSLDGLFSQGNFGIVTAAGFELLPRPEAGAALIARLTREEDLPDVVEALARLRRRGALSMVAHVGNRERSWITLAPLLLQELLALGAIPAGEEPRGFTENILRREGFGPWSAVAAIPGPAPLRRWAKQEIRRELGRYATLMFLNETKLKMADRLLSAISPFSMWARKKWALLRAVGPLHRLALGIPTESTIPGVYWPVPGAWPASGSNPDQGDAGLLYCLPLLPTDAASVRACVSATQEIFARHGFEPALTVNLLNDRSLEGVFSLAFPRSNPERTAAARACIREAEAFYIRSGWPPYRVGVESMDLIVDPESSYWKTIHDLKKALDPNNIIAPGRYNLS